ncbi:hypothetical protein ACWDWT_33650 [Streptomyces sp. NPDC003343]
MRAVWWPATSGRQPVTVDSAPAAFIEEEGGRRVTGVRPERWPAPVRPSPHEESGTMSQTLKIMSAIVATLVIAVGCFTQVF